MKKHFILAAWLLATIGIFFHGSPQAKASTQFVQNAWTYRSSWSYVMVCWDEAESTNTIPTITYQKTGDSSTVKTVAAINDGGGTSWCNNLIQLAEDTAYTVWINYANGPTDDGGDLSGYADYVASANSVVSATLSTHTTSRTARLFTADRMFVKPGEKVRVYGTNLGAGPSSLSSVTGLLWWEDPYIPRIKTGSYYAFPVTKWTNSYIEFLVPRYDATKTTQYGRLNLQNLLPHDGRYDINVKIQVIRKDSEVPRTVPSHYTGSTYRNLLNATKFHYGERRTATTFTLEKSNLAVVRSILKAQKKSIDTLRVLVLTNALTYGGYTRAEVRQEIIAGPGCVNIKIPKSSWSKRSEYKACMSQL